MVNIPKAKPDSLTLCRLPFHLYPRVIRTPTGEQLFLPRPPESMTSAKLGESGRTISVNWRRESILILDVRSVLIGLSPKTTAGSMLGIYFDVQQLWLSTCFSETTCRFRGRSQNSSDCSRTKRRVRPTLRAPDGVMDSSVITAARLASHTALPIAPVFSGVAIATVTRASPPAPSWNARTHRSRFGSGRRIWSPAKPPAYRLFSSSGNSDCRATKRPSRFFTNCALAWCDRISGTPEEVVEADETYVGGRTHGKGRGVHDMVIVAGAVEVRQRKHASSLNKRKAGRYAGRVRLTLVSDRSAKSLGGFIESTVVPGATIITDDWSGYAGLAERNYLHTAIPERGDMQIAETFLPIIHLVFSNLRTWLRGIHHGVSPQHLQAYLNEFTSPFLPLQCLPLPAGHRGRCYRANICGALCQKITEHYI